MVKHYYKVVRPGTNGKLFSCSVPFQHAVRYFKTKWTKAKVGGLLVFDDIDRALNYSHVGDIVYQCQCRIPVTLPAYRSWLPAMQNITAAGIAKLWKIFRYKRMSCAYAEGWPRGSMAFKEIKLTKVVKYMQYGY